MGYDAIMLAAPPTSLPTQRELAAHYRAVADAVDKPVVLYNYPARAGVEIGYECLDAVADHPNIVAIKESSGDFSRFLYLQRTFRRPTTSPGVFAAGSPAPPTCCPITTSSS